jgi:pseudouridine synthase
LQSTLAARLGSYFLFQSFAIQRCFSQRWNLLHEAQEILPLALHGLLRQYGKALLAMQRSPMPEPSSFKTLERVLSKAGVGSRTVARSMIHARRVEVNGHVIENPDHWVDLRRDRVRVDGQPLRSHASVYLLLYKPAGYLTTRKDPEGRPTVYDLLGEFSKWVFPVGRLDRDTSGLLLLTNDTQFGERLTNPEHKVPKTYLVKTATRLDDAALAQLRRGVEIGAEPRTLPAEVRRVRDSARRTWVEITITEGRNRQVRRMIEAVGSGVMKLVRIRLGPLEIGDLQIGRYRELTSAELAQLASRSIR